MAAGALFLCFVGRSLGQIHNEFMCKSSNFRVLFVHENLKVVLKVGFCGSQKVGSNPSFFTDRWEVPMGVAACSASRCVATSSPLKNGKYGNFRGRFLQKDQPNF